MAKHVAVLMGGMSSERPVSLSSGEACAKGLEAAGYRVTRVDVGPDIAEVLARLAPDVAFNALHGPQGEDGVIQGLLELLRIPYTHSGVRASALAMDKVLAKVIAASAGIPVAAHVLATPQEISSAHVLPPPYVVKPVADGSSFGITIVRDGAAPRVFNDDMRRYGARLMVEDYIAGRELTSGVLGDQVLGVTEIIPIGHDYYDFDAKYADGGSRHVCPAEIPDDLRARIEDFTLRAHRAMGCRGASRSDFRYDPETDRLIWLEVNTQPGMTPTSLLPELAALKGYDFPALVAWLVEDASLDR
jgi:D-alanine-D-alanine ligase